jgi:hypothetical protein
MVETYRNLRHCPRFCLRKSISQKHVPGIGPRARVHQCGDGFTITTAGLRLAMALCIFAGCISRRADRVTGAAWFDAPVSRANRNLGLGGRQADARRAEVTFPRVLSGPSVTRKQLGKEQNGKCPRRLATRPRRTIGVRHIQ